MPEVKIENPGGISVMALILKSIVDKNIADPSRYAKVADLDSVINIQAGKMKVQLIMNRGELEVKDGWHSNPTASVTGSMDAIMNVGMGKYHKIPFSFLTRNFKVGGNLMALMPLMTIMKM